MVKVDDVETDEVDEVSVGVDALASISTTLVIISERRKTTETLLCG